MDILRTRTGLLAEGYTADEVRALLRAGGLTAARRGAYVSGRLPDDRAARHLLQARAALGNLADQAVLSHGTAALAHGLPVWAVPMVHVHVTRDRSSGGRRGRRVHMHVAPLEPADIVLAHGMPVTAVARTVVDLARSVSFESAVVAADAALGAGLVDRAALDAALARSTGWPGCPAARRVLAVADGRSGSVGESRSRVAIARAGLPTPVPQWAVPGLAGRPIAWVDFGWPELATVGEFDGKVKYGRLLRPGQEPGDAVFEEKRREDAIRDRGLSMVRWTWQDLTDFTPVADRLRSRFR